MNMASIYFNDQLSLILNQIQIDADYNVKSMKQLIKKYSVIETALYQDFEYTMFIYKVNDVNIMCQLNDTNIANMIVENESGYDFAYVRNIIVYIYKVYLTFIIYKFGTNKNESYFLKVTDMIVNNIKILLESIGITLDVVYVDTIFHTLLEEERKLIVEKFNYLGVKDIIGTDDFEGVKIFFRNKLYSYDIMADNIISILLVR